MLARNGIFLSSLGDYCGSAVSKKPIACEYDPAEGDRSLDEDLQNQRQRLLQTRPNATIFSLTLLHACMKRGCDICMNTPPCYGQRLSASFYAITQPWAVTSVCQSLRWYIPYNACLLLDLAPSSPSIDNIISIL